MFSAVGIDGKTNPKHQSRARGAITVFEVNDPDNVIQEPTGHRYVKELYDFMSVLQASGMKQCTKF